MNTSGKTKLLAVTVLLLAMAVLFWQSPRGGAFWWSDAARHALNSAFVTDLLRDLPWGDPVGYAYRYYAQYPALTILFYPPLLYALTAPFYLLLGVSHEVALLVVFLHYFAFGLGCWRLARFWLAPAAALAFALLMVLMPEIALWGRQVMTEVPAFAYLVWSVVAFEQYRRSARPGPLYLAAALLVLGMYTKITVGFVGLVYLILLLQGQRALFWRSRHPYAIAALSLLALLPLLFMTLKFGQANVQSVTGVADAVASRSSIDGWLWYLKVLPSQMGWPLFLVAIAGLLWAAVRLPRPRPSWVGLWLAWFAVGYLFFSSIDLKEARHSVYLLLPLAFVATWAVQDALPRRPAWAALASLVLATAYVTLAQRPVPYVDGYARTVDLVARIAPKGSTVLFSGYRDGSFIFNLRAREDRRDLRVLRADKILLRLAVRRELGVEEKALSVAQIGELLNEQGVHYVVMQPGFWTDLEAMRRLEALMASPAFEVVARIPTPANHRAHETELVVLRNLGPVNPDPRPMEIELKMIGRTIPVN